ncbi:ribonuclease H-like domain-containing protein [Tanacetum coccineum]
MDFYNHLGPSTKTIGSSPTNTAKEAWDILTNIVKDNKRTRASTLKTELRSIQLGTLSMEAYFQKIESLVTTLTSLDCVVNDEDVVHYAITGLLGSCRFGSECRYVHDPNAKPHDFGTSKVSNTSNTDALLVQLLEKLNLKNKDASTNCSIVTSTKDTPPISPLPVAYSTQHNSSPACPAQQPTTGPISSGSTNTGHATLLPQAFTIKTLHDPNIGAWNMDTGASSHLNNSINSLRTVFNSCLYPSIAVGDGYSIPVTNTGHSILPTLTRPLHLNNVLITPHIVKILIYVRQFVRENNCTIEFDAFGFSVKDFLKRGVFFRCEFRHGDPTQSNTYTSPISHCFCQSTIRGTKNWTSRA